MEAGQEFDVARRRLGQRSGPLGGLYQGCHGRGEIAEFDGGLGQPQFGVDQPFLAVQVGGLPGCEGLADRHRQLKPFRRLAVPPQLAEQLAQAVIGGGPILLRRPVVGLFGGQGLPQCRGGLHRR